MCLFIDMYLVCLVYVGYDDGFGNDLWLWWFFGVLCLNEILRRLFKVLFEICGIMVWGRNYIKIYNYIKIMFNVV